MTILLTGASTGLGRAAAADLAAGGATVLATSRAASPAPGWPSGVAHHPLDLIDRASVDALVAAAPARLDALVLNAGLQVTGDARSPEGWELTFAANHLGHVRLLCGLLDRLGDGSRIVWVSSATHDPAVRTGLPDPRLDGARATALTGPTGRAAYATSKLANVMTALWLARALAGRGVTSVAYDPGALPGTGLAREAGPAARAAWSTVAHALRVLPGVTSPRRSGRVLADLTAGPAWDGVTGAYVSLGRVRAPSAQARDRAQQERLWRESLELLGLDDPFLGRPADQVVEMLR